MLENWHTLFLATYYTHLRTNSATFIGIREHVVELKLKIREID